MGAAMARSLAREGHDVAGRGIGRRRARKRSPLTDHRVRRHRRRAAGRRGRFHDAVRRRLVSRRDGEVVGALGDDAVWAQSHHRRARRDAPDRRGGGEPSRDRLLDAPVLGTKQPAEDGKLTVLVSGPTRARQQARPAFEAIGGQDPRSSATGWVTRAP